MTHHLRHPLLDGTAIGAVASLIAAAAAGWVAARRLFGPSRHPIRRPLRP